MRLRIHEAMAELSNAERKVARVFLAQYPMAGLATVAELAAKAGVSAPTVIRFTNKIGFNGFPTLQRMLVKELNNLGSPVRQYPQKTAHGQDASIFRKTGEAFASMTQATYREIPESEFQRLVTMLSDPKRRIFVSGGRFSRFLAEYIVFHLRLLRPGVELVAFEDVSRRAAIADADSSGVLLIFDYRRYSGQSQTLAQRMHERGAAICLMTDTWLSPIADIASNVLTSHVDGPSPFDSLVAATALVESLIAGVTEELGDAGLERLSLTEESFDPL